MTLTAALLREKLHYSLITGQFYWRVKPNTKIAENSLAGSINYKGYRVIGLLGKTFKAHRLAWLYVTGEWPKSQIDHKNCIRDDNSWLNIRQADEALNSQNRRRAHKDSKTGILGVSPKGDIFVAQICYEGRQRKLGEFELASDAQAAYLAAKRVHHEGCTI